MPTPTEAYKKLVSQGKINADANQLSVLSKLDELYNKLLNYDMKTTQSLLHNQQQQRKQQKQSKGWFSSLLSSSSTSEESEPQTAIQQNQNQNVPKTLYMYGGVGCGKTMLMDLFYNVAPTDKKLRIHFNSFMLNFHTRTHQLRSQNPGVDHIPEVIQEILEKHWLLCFDEFQVTDIADAMILKRIFEGLINNGAVVVATSNRPPDNLYENGLNRPIFIPFIHFLKERADVHNMNSGSDYRLSGTKSTEIYHIFRNDKERIAANESIEKLFRQLIAPKEPEKQIVTAMGARLTIPESARGVAKFTFDEICRRAYGANLYIELSKQYHTVIVTDIPQMEIFQQGDVIRRFILLVDELYQHHVKLICSAAVAPADLLTYPDGTTRNDHLSQDNVFAFDRTVSRLIEMNSKEYLQTGHSGQQRKQQ
jgi:predicted ATPase